MTVTMFSITPPTRHTSVYMMRKTQLNGPRTTPLPLNEDEVLARAKERFLERECIAARTLDDIDDWYSQTIEEDGFLEQLDRSAESVRFP